MDLIGPLHRTDHGNEYIVVMQDHFTKWIEGVAVTTKEAMLVANVIVNKWVYKHGTPLNLHNDRGTEFTATMHRCLCDLLRIHKMYSTAYNPQSNGAMERCNRTLLSMLRTVVSEQQNDWDDHLPAALCAYRSTHMLRSPGMREVGGLIPGRVKQKTLKFEVLLLCLALSTKERDRLAGSESE